LIKNQQIISPTRNTPEVILDLKGTIKLTGRLIPENAEDFFKPISCSPTTNPFNFNLTIGALEKT
jgi:hypothetical protein